MSADFDAAIERVQEVHREIALDAIIGRPVSPELRAEYHAAHAEMDRVFDETLSANIPDR